MPGLQVGSEFVLPSELAIAEVAGVRCCGAVHGIYVTLLFVLTAEGCVAVWNIAGYAGAGECYVLLTE